MRVPTYAFANTLVNQLQTLSTQQAQYENEMSTGQSITNPSDDPAAAEQVMDDETAQQQLAQYSKNNSLATDISNASYAAVSSLQSLVSRAIQLSTLGSGVTDSGSLSAYATEVNSMISEAVDAANTTYNGNYLFGGSKNNTPPVVDDGTGTGHYTYAGSSTSISFQTGAGSTVSPYTNATQNQSMVSFVNDLVDLKNALNGSSTTPSLTTIAASLETDETNITNTVSSIGATQSGLEADETENTTRFNNLTTLISDDASADIAQTTVKYTAAQTCYQAAMEAGAKILQTSLIDYLS